MSSPEMRNELISAVEMRRIRRAHQEEEHFELQARQRGQMLLLYLLDNFCNTPAFREDNRRELLFAHMCKQLLDDGILDRQLLQRMSLDPHHMLRLTGLQFKELLSSALTSLDTSHVRTLASETNRAKRDFFGNFGDSHNLHRTISSGDLIPCMSSKSFLLQVSRFQEEFEKIRILGKGGFACVYEMKHKMDDVHYAVKEIKFKKCSNVSKDRLLHEVKALAKLNHPNIVRYYQAWIEQSSSFDYKTMGLEQKNDSKQKGTELDLVFEDSNNVPDFVHSNAFKMQVNEIDTSCLEDENLGFDCEEGSLGFEWDREDSNLNATNSHIYPDSPSPTTSLPSITSFSNISPLPNEHSLGNGTSYRAPPYSPSSSSVRLPFQDDSVELTDVFIEKSLDVFSRTHRECCSSEDLSDLSSQHSYSQQSPSSSGSRLLYETEQENERAIQPYSRKHFKHTRSAMTFLVWFRSHCNIN
eukprot:GCRY01006000.1.p1 GENE.GCRY01006000.1~~GCRY01006000.1.p1  ORF type:complete len:470 (+),score=43.96 GCRY01006000.1:59-1468(+)